jgi:hypothetical protein
MLYLAFGFRCLFFRAIQFFLVLAAGLYLVPTSSAAVLVGTYKLPASVDPEVTTELATELWAEVVRPATPSQDGRYPLLVFLHGNHNTCGRFDPALGVRIDDRNDYTTSGTCPPGYVPTPNHLGYDYLATALADMGYVVVSINANRGVNGAPGVSGDNGLNLRRGRLVLRHMEQLSQWNAGIGRPPSSLGFGLTGLLDFSHVGLMGHSRGGEGMRAAVAQYRDAGSPWPTRIGAVGFEALFEIAPVDGQTGRILNAVDLAWNVLLPGCDGDVSDLRGVRPLDRMIQITTETRSLNKSSFEVYGANHNFYNTEWQVSDSPGCLGQTPLFPPLLGSAAQRTTASGTLVPFFFAHVGVRKHADMAQRFDPSFPLPPDLTAITAYARGFTPTPRAAENFVIDNFDNATGISSENVANQFLGLASYSHGAASTSHDPTQRAATVGWTNVGGFLQVNASDLGVPRTVTAFRALEFRVMLRCPSVCNSTPDPTGDVDFSIALANSNGRLSSPVTLKSVAVVRRPVGASQLNFVFQTVRIPLASFKGANLAQFRGVRFTFDRTASSLISLGNVRLTDSPAGPGRAGDGEVEVATQSPVTSAATMSKATPVSETNRIVSIRSALAHTEAGSSQAGIEIEVTSSRAFPVGGALPVLKIGAQSFTLSRFPIGKTDHLIFTLDPTEFASLSNGAEVSVIIGGAPQWSMGRLRKP